MTRAVLITGSSEGIGYACAAAFLHAGYRVAICARRQQGLDRAVASLAGGARVLALVVDVTEPASIAEGLATLARSDFEPEILVNNAGAAGHNASYGADLPDKLAASLEVNLFGAVRLCAALAPAMVARRWGRIVNVASTAGLGAPLGIVPYATSKAALIAFTKSLANELADRGVTVNAVAPGPVATDSYRASKGAAATARRARSIPSGRLADPADVANAVLFLGGESSSHVTGQILAIDGGEQAAGPYAAMWVDRRSTGGPA